MSRKKHRHRVKYQPIFGPDGQLYGFEALSPPRSGITAAQLFRLTRWVLAIACRQAAAWQRRQPGLCVEINIPPSQLLNPRFADIVAGALEHSGLLGPQLILELLENEAIDFDDPVVRRNLARLCALGVQVALDDLGSDLVATPAQARSRVEGNRTHAWQFLCQTVKLDRSLVQAEDYGRLAAFLRLAARYGLTVIAEGIETLEHLVRLLILQPGVRIFCQGYYFGKKVSPREFEARWLPQPSTI